MDTEFSDGIRHCADWAKQYVYQNALVIGTSVMIAVINTVVCIIFDRLTYLEA